MISTFKPNLNSRDKVIFILDWRKNWLNKYFTTGFEGSGITEVELKDNLINQSQRSVNNKAKYNNVTSDGVLYCANSTSKTKLTFFSKQTKVMLFFQITDDRIKLLPLDIQNKYFSADNPAKLEWVFKDKSKALTVQEVSKRFKISKEIIYENLDTLNYIKVQY